MTSPADFASARPILSSGIAAIVLLAADFAWNGPKLIQILDTIVHAHGWAICWALLLAAVCGALAWFASRRGSRWPNVVAAALAALGVVGIAAYAMTGQRYAVEHTYASQVATVEQAPSFEDRAPWVVADALASRDQGDAVGDRGAVSRVPGAGDEGASRYTSIVTGRATFFTERYASVLELSVPMSGQAEGSTSACQFEPTADRRYGSLWPWMSLDRAVRSADPFLHFDADDRYGYCQDGAPVIVQPLWRWDGFWVSTRVPAGAAVYSASGELRILSADQLVAEGVDGPTMPRSITSDIRSSLGAIGSFEDWIAGRGGWDGTEKDGEDANAGNASEFTLVGVGGEVSAATPLTPRGSSQSITALYIAPAQQGLPSAAGHSGPVVATGLGLPATSSIENTIRSASVAGDPEWSTRWAAGMTVYEIVPGKDGHWVASIGLGQIVNYRADIAPDGSVSVQRTDGQGASAPTATAEGGKPLSEMTERELVDLIQQAADELERRG